MGKYVSYLPENDFVYYYDAPTSIGYLVKIVNDQPYTYKNNLPKFKQITASQVPNTIIGLLELPTHSQIVSYDYETSTITVLATLTSPKVVLLDQNHFIALNPSTTNAYSIYSLKDHTN
jgi:hypothetical protein